MFLIFCIVIFLILLIVLIKKKNWFSEYFNGGSCVEFNQLDYSPVMLQSYSVILPKKIDQFYKTLLDILNNNPSALTKYFGVQLPPPSGPTEKCDTEYDRAKNDTWCRVGYVPKFYWDLDSRGNKILAQNYYGSRDEHHQLLDALNKNCIEPIADIVVNHRDGDGEKFKRPQMGSMLESIAKPDNIWSNGPRGCQLANQAANAQPNGPEEKAFRDYARENPMDYCVQGILTNEDGSNLDGLRVYRSGDPCSESDNVACGSFGHELAHGIGNEPNQPNAVRKGIVEYLKFLQSQGYKGWRFDMVLSIYASAIGYYVGQTGNPYNVGELWKSDVSQLVNYINYSGNNAVRLFDFPLWYTLAGTLGSLNFSGLNRGDGKQPGLVGVMPNNAVTFIENHDTWRSNRFPSGKEMLGYVYILTHPGIPQVFGLHDYDLKEVNKFVSQDAGQYNPEWYKDISSNLNALIALRKRSGVQNDNQSVNIIQAGDKVYRAQIRGKHSNLFVKFGNDVFAPQGNWSLVITGQAAFGAMGYAVWESK